ncbi:hypothetical protein [Streptomyces sviceus]|uniref:hypothetical protein n=1 Tax=Streptomyces sviceus TaxID=285530 RepID=UPI003333F1E3
MSELIRRGASDPETRPKWRRRVDRQRAQDAWTEAEVQKIETVARAECDRITAAGRAQLHADRARYTEALTVHVGLQFVDLHDDMARLRMTNPEDPVLSRALAEIEAVGFGVLKSHLRDHERDGRERF